jgi:hypothetical protein
VVNQVNMLTSIKYHVDIRGVLFGKSVKFHVDINDVSCGKRDCHGLDHMVVGFTTTFAFCAYHH